MRVLIVDDHAAVRRSLTRALQEEPGIDIVGEAPDGAEAVRLADRLKPDVVLMDIVMPGIDGIEATRQIMRSRPQTRVIGLSVHDSMSYAAGMLDAGACAYLLKDCDMADLVQEIHWAGSPIRRSNDAAKLQQRLTVRTR